jgi:hypothetical protein
MMKGSQEIQRRPSSSDFEIFGYLRGRSHDTTEKAKHQKERRKGMPKTKDS